MPHTTDLDEFTSSTRASLEGSPKRMRQSTLQRLMKEELKRMRNLKCNPLPLLPAGVRKGLPLRCTGLQGFLEGLPKEECNIGRWYRWVQNAPLQWLSDPVDFHDLPPKIKVLVALREEYLRGDGQVQNQVRNPKSTRKRRHNISSSPIPSSSTAIESPEPAAKRRRCAPSSPMASSSTAAPSSPQVPSTDTLGIRLNVTREDGKEHDISVVARRDGYVYLADAKLRLGELGIEKSQRVLMWRGHRTGYIEVKWEEPLNAEFGVAIQLLVD
ncbi:hypothetical protein H0H93_002606 [Arthromyces matolae]|nr:hypothetical protein H0H93_002606 [Arthromyces matolae]